MCAVQSPGRREAEASAATDRPVVIAGNGVHDATVYMPLRRVAEPYGCVFTMSYLGKSTFQETDPLAGSVIGSPRSQPKTKP